MENIFRLINNRLHNLEGVIKQHRYCLENNISVDLYKDNLTKLEKEQDELKREYEELKKYCVTR